MALIAQYLLYLAENPHAAELHNSSPEAADLQMRAYGLSDTQCAAIASGDKQQISDALTNELPAAAAPGKTMTFQITPTVLLRG